MKIIKRIPDNTVLFANEDLTLNETGAYKDGWKTRVVNTSNAVIETVSSLPDNFINGGFTYIGGVWATNALGDAYIAEIAARQAEQTRIEELETAVKIDAIIAQLKAMDNSEFDSWWTANVTNTAQAIGVLKRLAKVIIRRVL